MMKKHGRLWSLALAGALTVSNLSLVMTPLTAFAADPTVNADPTGNADAGDTINFSAGETGATFADTFTPTISIVDDQATTGPGQVKKADPLPDNDASTFTTAVTVPAGYEFVWANGRRNLVPDDSKYYDIKMGAGTSTTLVAKTVAKKYEVTLSNLTKGAVSEEDTTKKTKTYKTDLAKIEDPELDYYEFRGWSLDNASAMTADIAKGAAASVQSAKFDENFATDTSGGSSSDAYDHNVTAYALWNENVYSISYDITNAKTGTTPESLSWKISNDSTGAKTILGSSPSEAGTPESGMVFANWNTKKDGTGLEFDAGADVKDVVKEVGSKSFTLYSVFEPEPVVETPITVTLDDHANKINKASTSRWIEGSDEFTQDILPSVGSVTLPEVSDNPMPSKNQISFNLGAKETFEGWDDEEGETTGLGKAVKYVAGETIPVTKPITLYPVISTAVDDATVTFTVNASTAVEDASAMKAVTGLKAGDKFTLPESGYTAKERYHFVNYRFSGREYAPGQEITLVANSAVTANYAADTFTLEYYKGTSRIKSVTVNAISGTNPLGKTSSSDTNFLGWDTDKDAKNPLYNENTQEKALYTFNGDTVKIYAIIPEQKVTVTYYDNDGTNDTVAAGADFNLRETANLSSGELYGWTTRKYDSKEEAESYGATIYLKGSTFRAGTANLKFYPITQEAASVLTLHVNGSTADSQNDMVVKTYDSTYAKLPENTYSNPGYTFLGWALTEDKSTAEYVKYADKATDVDNSVSALWAVWKPCTYRFVFDKNSSAVTGSITSKLVSSDATYISKDAAVGDNLAGSTGLTPDLGYTFLGWALTSSAKKATYTATDYYADVIRDSGAEDEDTITLYAVWNKPAEVEKAQAEAEAAKEAEEEAKAGEAAAKEDAANQKAEADQAKAAKEATDKELATAKEELSKVSKAQNNVDAETGEKVDTKVDGSAVITSIPATAIKNGKYEVPSTIKVNGADYTVTKIEAKALKNNKQIKQITVPSTVTEIGTQAFQGAKNLKKVTIKGKDVVIRKNAFKKINKKAKIFVADKDTKTNVTSKGGAPKTVKVKVKK